MSYRRDAGSPAPYRRGVHVLDESHILLFLLQVMLLLGAARTLGVVCERFHIPAIAGEIVAGVLFGPTVLGRFAPALKDLLFPHEAVQATMLETVSWLGVFFLLLASGFHVDVRQALKSGKAALSVGIVGVLVPIAIGVPVFWSLDEKWYGPAAEGAGFAMFLAVAGSITAISVVARALGDLGIARSREGGLALSACAVNDIFGWLLFTVVMSVATGKQLSAIEVTTTFLATLGFIAVCIAAGSQVLGFAAKLVSRTNLSQAAALQTLVVSAGLLCGAITQWLGIHAILGFFLAGTMAGSAPNISHELRESFSDTAHAIFVPLFFATLGLNIDFVTGLHLGITALFTAVAVGGKFIGAWIGARLGGVEPGRSVLLGLIFVPGGAMEIVVGALALEFELISQPVFVAIVFAALASSIVAGPLVGWQARRLHIRPGTLAMSPRLPDED